VTFVKITPTTPALPINPSPALAKDLNALPARQHPVIWAVSRPSTDPEYKEGTAATTTPTASPCGWLAAASRAHRVGETDERRRAGGQDRFAVTNLHATVLQQLGLDPDASLLPSGLNPNCNELEIASPIRQIMRDGDVAQTASWRYADDLTTVKSVYFHAVSFVLKLTQDDLASLRLSIFPTARTKKKKSSPPPRQASRAPPMKPAFPNLRSRPPPSPSSTSGVRCRTTRRPFDKSSIAHTPTLRIFTLTAPSRAERSTCIGYASRAQSARQHCSASRSRAFALTRRPPPRVARRCPPAGR